MLLDMLFELEPNARVFAIDTHYLFPETYAYWRAVEERYDTAVERFEGPTSEELATTRREPLGDEARPLPRDRQARAAEPGAARPRLLDHRGPPRPVANARRRGKDRLGRSARALEGEPARRLERRRLLGIYPQARAAVQRRCTIRATARSATPTRAIPGAGREGRWAGMERDRVRPARVGWERSWSALLRPLAHGPVRRRASPHWHGVVATELERRGLLVERLDGDVVREHLSKGLGFSKADRDTNIGRIGWVASRLARAGAVVVVSAISPYERRAGKRAA